MNLATCLRTLLASALLLPTLAWAQSVTLAGTLGAKALLIVDGGAPRALAPGETLNGVTLLATQGDQAVVRAGGQRLTLRVGEAPLRVGSATPEGGDRVALSADARGHFFAQGSINNRPVRFMVDTGASVVALSQAEAERLRLDYQASPRVVMNTANGTSRGWRLKLDSVRVGDVLVYNVDAVVVPAEMPAVLLGNSFLNRFSMRREASQMMLIRR